MCHFGADFGTLCAEIERFCTIRWTVLWAIWGRGPISLEHKWQLCNPTCGPHGLNCAPITRTSISWFMREWWRNSCLHDHSVVPKSCDACVRGMKIHAHMAHHSDRILAMHVWEASESLARWPTMMPNLWRKVLRFMHEGYQNPCPYSMQGDPSYGLKAWHLCEKGSIKLWAYMAHYVFPTLAIYIWWVFKSVSI